MASSNRQSRLFNSSIELLVNRIRMINSAGLGITLKSESYVPNGMQFLLSHGFNMFSWGEEITITLVAIGPNTTNVDIFSCCVMPTQIIDWGKNKQNVQKVFYYLASACDYAVPPQTVNYAENYTANYAPQYINPMLNLDPNGLTRPDRDLDNTDPDMVPIPGGSVQKLKEEPVDPTLGMEPETLTYPEYYPQPDPNQLRPPRTHLPNINDLEKK